MPEWNIDSIFEIWYNKFVSFNASPITSRTFLAAAHRVETREGRTQKAIEVCVAGLAELVYAVKYEATTYGLDRDGSAQVCLEGIKRIDPQLCEAFLNAYADYEKDGARGREMVGQTFHLKKGVQHTTSSMALFSDARIIQFTHSMASYLWSIHEKNLYARSALARILAVDGSLLNPRNDRKNGIVQADAGVVSPVHNENSLCRAAENKLAASESKDRYVTVNKHLRVKLVGYVVALCTQSFRTPNGQVFLKGVFYSPDEETKTMLKREYKDKKIYKATIDLPDATWHVVRAYNKANFRPSLGKIFPGHS